MSHLQKPFWAWAISLCSVCQLLHAFIVSSSLASSADSLIFSSFLHDLTSMTAFTESCAAKFHHVLFLHWACSSWLGNMAKSIRYWAVDTWHPEYGLWESPTFQINKYRFPDFKIDTCASANIDFGPSLELSRNDWRINALLRPLATKGLKFHMLVNEFTSIPGAHAMIAEIGLNLIETDALTPI